ncbi:MAG: hypothetical protein K2X93_08120 [Candidatus Obscuribacterales bacterium]|nr:hypothetical protein [Candidatus Obscuribacterales bacterium]
MSIRDLQIAIDHSVKALLCVALTSCTLAGCGSPVSVKKTPLAVKTVLFDPDNPGNTPLTPDEEAVTIWSFGCKTDFDFDIVDNTMLSKDDVMVTLKISSSKITLTAPITVFLPKGASEELKRHEDGHVQICRRIYQDAEKEAGIAAAIVVGKEYQASGKTVEEACRIAVERASADVCLRYHGISHSVSRISDVYDSIYRTEHGDMQAMIDKAFSKYSVVRGVSPETVKK